MTGKPDGKRTGWTAALGAVVLMPLLYMGAYYSTIMNDAAGGCLLYQRYQIGKIELPDWTHSFFGPADWLDDRVHIAPCRRPFVVKVSMPTSPSLGGESCTIIPTPAQQFAEKRN
jgi:hypothetical protein